MHEKFINNVCDVYVSFFNVNFLYNSVLTMLNKPVAVRWLNVNNIQCLRNASESRTLWFAIYLLDMLAKLNGEMDISTNTSITPNSK